MSKAVSIEKVDFSFIRYANCWEDADLLLTGFNASEGAKFLSIGSAGDNSFSLLSTNPELVVAVDINPVQLHLVELKKAAIKSLDCESYLAFMGFNISSKRLSVFNEIKVLLPPDALQYWESNLALIEKGIIYQGKFEKYFLFFSSKIMPLIHSRRTIDALFQEKSEAAQVDFYNKKWNTRLWRLLFNVFFSKPVMGKFGRDPQFLKEVKLTVSEYIFQKAANHLKSKEMRGNYFLHFILTGTYGNALPHYVRPENYAIIKKNIDKLQSFQGNVQEAISRYGHFDFMNLSDIFEYMDDNVFLSIANELLDGLTANGKMAYWNLMVPRKISDILHGTAKAEDIDRLAKQDKGFFYNRFIIDTKI